MSSVLTPPERIALRAKAELELTRWLRTYGCLGYGECMELMDTVFVALYQAWRERREALQAASEADARAARAEPDPE